MGCKRCDSESQGSFNGEIAIHFPGLKGLDKPIMWMFPKLAVCLECGFAEFAVPDEPLATIKEITTQDSRGASA
jgi:hypothetical protein